MEHEPNESVKQQSDRLLWLFEEIIVGKADDKIGDETSCATTTKEG